MSNARGFIDDAAIDFSCPQCGRTVKTTVGAGRRNEPIRCPGGHTISVEGAELDRATKQAEKSLNDILKKFGS